ncbi:MAG: DNA recombination protein RmuC [Verrucomicrobiales bacterium]|jgi:DNA recombination protein RmuC|nr:DNA recombination protein RmuC [Verrucomicrobiales bacterium]
MVIVSAALLVSVLAVLMVSWLVILRLATAWQHKQNEQIAGLRELLQKSLGDQKSDFRDFNSANTELLRKSIQDSLTNQSLLMEKRFESLQDRTGQRLQEIRANVEKQLQQNLEQNFSAFKNMTKSLGDLKVSADQMLKVSQQVGELNQILGSPKLQGNFGEAELERLLADILPAGAFELQPRLAEGCQPDATIRIKDLRLCVDSKFPKDRIATLLAAADDETGRETARKELAAVVKLMAADIGKKYVRPELGTTDQAFLFVPSESLYYEILKLPELTEHCRRVKVSVVSPNTLASTLYAVALAFRGYEMQENAKALLRTIQDMDKHFQNFRKDFASIGQRIRQAQDDYEKAGRDLDRFDKTITKLRDGESRLTLEEKPAADGQAG